jgi:hypothetical protein
MSINDQYRPKCTSRLNDFDIGYIAHGPEVTYKGRVGAVSDGVNRFA